MKRAFFKFLTFAVLIAFVSCKNEATLEYKYAENPKVLACDFPKGDLYKEAVFAFEQDIVNLYDKKGQSVPKAYLAFVTNALNGRMKVEDIASEHGFNIAKALKKDSSIWDLSSKNVTLNYSAPFMDCIANNIKTSDLKITFNALLSTNSMRPNLILTPLRSSARQIQADGSLKTFVAFEYYYAKLMNMDPSLLKRPEAESATTVTKTPNKAAVQQPAVIKDDHAGHNH